MTIARLLSESQAEWCRANTDRLPLLNSSLQYICEKVRSRLNSIGYIELNLRDLVWTIWEHFSALTEEAVGEARTYIACVERLENKSQTHN